MGISAPRLAQIRNHGKFEGWGDQRRRDGAGPDHSLHRNGHLPSHYRNHQYVVNNWREPRLHPPPLGQQ
jgi:Ni/Co efflux regulator RcnB